MIRIKGSFLPGTGPLQLLFPNGVGQSVDSLVDLNKLNVFITDLAEQNKQNGVLANNILAALNESPALSAGLFALRSKYIGVASIANSGAIEEDRGGSGMLHHSFAEPTLLPFYIILLGPTNELLKFAADLRENKLRNQSIENEFQAFINGGGMQIGTWKAQNTQNAGRVGQEYSLATAKEPGINVRNCNANFQIVATSAFFPEQTNDIITSLYYAIDPISTKINQARLNLYCPLPGLLDASGKLDASGRPKSVETVYSPEIDAVSGVRYWVADGESGYAWQFTVPGKDSDKVEWVTASDIEGDRRLLTLDTYAWSAGERIPLLGDATSQAEEDAKKLLEEINVFTAPEPAGALQISLRLNDLSALRARSSNGYIAVRVPIEAEVRQLGKTPDWVDNWTCPPGLPSSDVRRFTQTLGLNDFFDTINGKLGLAQTRSLQIFDIVIYIKLAG